MKFYLISLIAITSLFTPYQSSAHGGDVPGPHGGAVEMPGAFHTEVIDKKNGVFEVYLLDVEFKNASADGSKVDGFVDSKGQKSKLACVVKDDHFVCSSENKKSGSKLHLFATREKSPGNEVVYKLPVVAPLAKGRK
jgi:hypothetical protein